MAVKDTPKFSLTLCDPDLIKSRKRNARGSKQDQSTFPSTPASGGGEHVVQTEKHHNLAAGVELPHGSKLSDTAESLEFLIEVARSRGLVDLRLIEQLASQIQSKVNSACPAYQL